MTDPARRGFLVLGTALVASFAAGSMGTARADAMSSSAYSAVQEVLPKEGVTLPFSFGDAIQKLVAAGVLDPKKYRALYQSAGNAPPWVARLLQSRSRDPILFSAKTAPYLLNLLWPLGLATRMRINRRSPLNTLRIPTFASTGGWSLGRKPLGYLYFNNVDTMALSDEQEALVSESATRTFRPCCDNPTFFQDCNHGSALLGLIALAASQGGTMREIFDAALVANSYWFPDKYVLSAMQLKRTGHPRWNALDPRFLLDKDISSLSGWQRNVYAPLVEAHVELPSELRGQLACGT